jgi:hypothetical protein
MSAPSDGRLGTYGKILSACALGPVEHARAWLAEGRTDAGVAELSHDALRAGLGLGIDLIAGRAGARVDAIEALLPMEELTEVLERVARSQPAALRALAGASSAPADALAGARLAALGAREAEAGRGVAGEALAALARDVERWERALGAACARIDRGEVLVRFERRRRLRLALTALAVALLACALVLFALAPALRARAARERIERAAGLADPCAALAIADDDLELATEPQRDLVATKLARCEGAAIGAKGARLLREREARRRAEEQRAARAHEARCTALADHVEAGALDPADDAVAGPAADLVRRIAARSLEPKDFDAGAPALPCERTPARARLDAAAARAYAAASAIWAGLDDVPPEVVAILAANGATLGDHERRAFSWHAEEVAEKAVQPGATRYMPGAARWCGLKASLGFDLGVDCRAVAKAARL